MSHEAPNPARSSAARLRGLSAVLLVVAGCFGGLPAVSHAGVYPLFDEQSSPGDTITNNCPTSTAGGEPVQSCEALADQLSSVRWRLGALHDSLRAGLAGLGDQLDTLGGLPAALDDVNANLSTLHDDLVALDAATSGGVVVLSPADRKLFEDAQGAGHADTWFLAGLLASFLAAFMLKDVFRP